MPRFGTLTAELLTRELGTDDSTELFTDQRRQDAIREGEEQFADLTECLIRQTSIATSGTVREYAINSSATGSTDFVRMAPQGPEYRLVSSVSTAIGSTQRTVGADFPRKDIERLNRERPGWRDSTGQDLPNSWYLRNDGGQWLFGFSEPPEVGSSETGTLLIPYIARAVGSTESTHIPFTVGSDYRPDLIPYHRAIVHYAAHDLEKLRKDREQSDYQLQKFMGWVARYKQDMRPRTGHQTISQHREYFRESRGGKYYSGDPFRDD